MAQPLPQSSAQLVPSSGGPPTQPPEPGPLARLKSWAWRFTACYLWVHWVLSREYGRDILAGSEHATGEWVVTHLASVGYAPTNVGVFPVVFVVIWFLIITRLSPLQLFVGFPLYLIFAPISVLFSLIFRKTLKAAREKPAQNNSQSPVLKKRFPLVPLLIALIIGWLLLYGGSFAKGPNTVGCALSGGLFLILAYRALGKTSRMDERNMAVLRVWATRGILIMQNLSKQVVDKPPKSKVEVATSLFISRLGLSPFRRVRIIFGGNRGKNRIAMIILGEYIFFLFLLAASAILFWAFALKVAVTSQPLLSLTAALTISASHFLPAINIPSPTNLPWWGQFGPALTSWTLFVVYIGPVSSALPMRQDDFMKRIAPIQADFTLAVKLWHIYRGFMNGCRREFMKM